MRVRDDTVTTRGLRLHFREWGCDAESAPNGHVRQPIVLVHGLSSTAHIWDLVAPELAAEWRVVALDQRGHGESSQPDTGYDYASVVADLAAFLDAIGIQAPAILVGHSWGASVVLRFAVDHADRTAGVVLLDGGTGSPGETMTWDETLARLTPPEIDGRLWSDLRRHITAGGRITGDPRLAAIGESLFHIQPDGTVRRRLSIPNHLKILRALWEERPADLMPCVRCPLLIMPARQASDDPDRRASQVERVERLLAVQPLARVRWFEDTIHDVPLQRPSELAAELASFARIVFVDRVSARS
jgi:pimeloyl-ACP methyl ester carboxylesterase